MTAIVRKEKQRKTEQPSKDSIFRVRKHPVEPREIARFKRDKCFNNDDVTAVDASTISQLRYLFMFR